MLSRIVGYYNQVGSVTNDVLAAECEMELIDEKELFSYIVENSEREGHFDYYEDRSKTWSCVWLQEVKLRLMLPSTIELCTNVNNYGKIMTSNFGWCGLELLTTYLPGSI